MQPGKVSAAGFHDAAAHRQELHSLYNGYTFINSDPSFALHTDLQPVLRPLFTTSFLIDDFLDDEDFFDADQVLLLSASSKTALGTAYCLKQRGGITVVGLTSSGNQAFTESTKFYDIVHTYDAIEAMDKNVKTVVVDMSGNAAVIDMLEAECRADDNRHGDRKKECREAAVGLCVGCLHGGSLCFRCWAGVRPNGV